ncbi:MAG: hypothetical protein IPJ98_17930 [Bryobacterales bacterium]|nr:hypothetical protein [Bryobacterales bacterium]
MDILVSALLASFASGPARAVLGIGDIVFDPTNLEQAIRQVIELQRQYEQLVNTYHVLRSEYDHILYMARRVPVNMMTRYRVLATPWRNSTATDTYGGTGSWITGVNTGFGVDLGYARATQSLGTYGAAIGSLPAGQIDRVKSTYATVELTDGANRHAMELIGRLRWNAAATERAIQGLEEDSLSANPDFNTEIAVLNKINAAHIVSVRNTQDSNKLLVALAEAGIVDAKRKRDAEAQAINNHIRFRTEGKAALDAQSAGASAAMLAWRMP